jgi:hypothetical protein
MSQVLFEKLMIPDFIFVCVPQSRLKVLAPRRHPRRGLCVALWIVSSWQPHCSCCLYLCCFACLAAPSPVPLLVLLLHVAQTDAILRCV